MDFELSDEQELVRNTVREFADAELAPVAAEIDRDHRFPEEVVPEHGRLEPSGHALPGGGGWRRG